MVSKGRVSKSSTIDNGAVQLWREIKHKNESRKVRTLKRKGIQKGRCTCTNMKSYTKTKLVNVYAKQPIQRNSKIAKKNIAAQGSFHK